MEELIADKTQFEAQIQKLFQYDKQYQIQKLLSEGY